jgi:hypothetical protein
MSSLRVRPEEKCMRNQNLRARNLVGLVVSVAMLVSASGAGAQTNYKTLYKFGFGQGGEVLGAGLSPMPQEISTARQSRAA